MFFDGVSSLGAATLISGAASISTVLLGSGAHRLSAFYSGDAVYASSASNTVSEAITTKPENVLVKGAAPPIPSEGAIYWLAVADLNRDGVADIVLTRFSEINVLLGNGDGTFGNPIDAGIQASDVRIGDFNGDGIPDLVYSSSDPRFYLSISLGRGDGTFQPPILSPAKPSTAQSPSGFEVGDFNRDGKLDIVGVGPVAVYSSVGQILLFAGNGDGSFQTPVSYAVSTLATPMLAAIGDFNADGKPDLLLEAQTGSPNFCVQLGKGDGSFQNGPCFTAPTGARIAITDMDGDGRDDVVLATPGPNTVSVLLSNGDGSFTSRAQPLQDFPNFIATGDFTGDGKADLIVLSQHGGANGAGGMAILPGNGDGTFQDAAHSTPVTFPSSAVVGDFNQDGRLDVIIGSDLGGYTPVNTFFGFMASMTVTGSGQATAPGQPFQSALQATILDDIGRPIPGVTIVFTAPTTGASARLDNAAVGYQIVTETDQSGGTSVSASANLTAGNYAVLASSGFLQGSFALSNSLDQPGSFAVVPTTVAPNTIASAYGNLAGCSQGAQVLESGVAAEVFYSSDTQINFLFPSTTAVLGGAYLQIVCGSLKTARLLVPTAPAAPSIFTMSQTNTGQADVVNQDSRVGPPSAAGTIISVFGTGFGRFAPTGADGLTRLALPVTATIGNVPATVLYAGSVPGSTSGLQQINLAIPAAAPPGAAVPLMLTVGGISAQPGVTLAIQ
jgi:uncharacterized protein (TIGR03437 family)